MRDLYLPPLREKAKAWRVEADQRRRRVPGDPAAATLESCADELEKEVERLDREKAYLTVAEFAHVQGVDPSSVRKWVARAELEGAEKGPDGEWRIPRDSKRRLRQVAS